ncbi:Ca-activated chloride channel homolog [Lebetimonas natsushimae]|uniref:Ca-activated chloride channel homolog n=1 Tax=Lebetimonas natsushimae TaxID=1936991 RepID=A0A292YC02_9BACT|nr:VWA domain-containing protein [Lebetimonas natsushimae]GAX87049.1 Ca-activated chloride channel homolog [Lebetimonas natsushimae]
MFEYPIFLLIPVIYIICRLKCPLRSDKIIFPNAFILKYKKFINIWEFLTVLFLSIALASPVKTKIIYTQKKGYDIVIDLDTSGSMAQFDKLTVSKEIINDFIQKRKNDRLGLVIFGNIAYIASPLTPDKKALSEILKRVYPGIAGEKTAIYDALFLSTNLFKNSNAKDKVIILLTDGMDNSSVTPIDIVIKKLKKEKIKVYTIGIGDEIDRETLRIIANKTGGRFFNVFSTGELKEIYKTINKLEKTEIKSNIIIKKKYYFEYPLILAIFFFLIMVYKRQLKWKF